jgi:hypothetical protein
MLPVTPAPTIALIEVGETMLNEYAEIPPNFTEVTPLRLEPVMVTVSPEVAFNGVNDVIVGAGITVF